MSRKLKQTIILDDDVYNRLMSIPFRVSVSSIINKSLKRYFVVFDSAIQEIEYKIKKGVYNKCGR